MCSHQTARILDSIGKSEENTQIESYVSLRVEKVVEAGADEAQGGAGLQGRDEAEDEGEDIVGQQLEHAVLRPLHPLPRHHGTRRLFFGLLSGRSGGRWSVVRVARRLATLGGSRAHGGRRVNAT